MKKKSSAPSFSAGRPTRDYNFLGFLGLCVGTVPYLLGPLVTRPMFIMPEVWNNTITHYVERSVVFFAYATLLNLLIGSILRRKKNLRSTMTILFLGLPFLVTLAKAKYTYQLVHGAFFSLLILMALLPLQASLKMQKKWRRHVACVIFTAFFIALTSLTVHYSESPFFGFAIAILAPSPQIALSSLIEALPPIMLSIAAGCLGAVYGLLGTHTFEETANLRPELNGTPEPEIISDIPIWYTSVVVILLAIPPITLGLMAVQGFLPGMYRFAYGGIAGPVVLNSLCRHGQLPQRNFTKGAYFTVLILLVFFVVLGLPEMAFFTQSGFFSR